MKRTILLFAGLLLYSLGALAQTEYTTIMDRIRAEQLAAAGNITTLDNGVTTTLASLQTNGSWADITYTYSSTTYTADVHLTRIKNFALAYSQSSSAYYHSTAVFAAITSSLGYWDTADPQSWNWYHNQISNPQRLGEILILLYIAPQSLPTTLYNNLLAQMNRGVPSAQTGANKLDVATHFIYRACLTADATLMNTGVTEAFYPIMYTTQEGIQQDLSYQQHGPQLYVFGYGSVLVDGEVKVAYYLRGTSYALSGTKLALLGDFVRKGYLGVMRGRYIDFGVNGRSISRANSLSQQGVSNALNKLKVMDSMHVTEYNQAIARLQNTQPPSYMITASHTHFWRSDYTVHQRAGYFFGVRNVSTRTARSENGNGENLKGYYLSDGATNIAVNGNEYYNLQPVWDWSRIPGTTVPFITTFPLRAGWGANFGTAAFSGGVSDSVYGASALAFSDYSTQAKKAWFFFDNEVVCLGAGIQSTATQAINTTVNQCLLSGTVTALVNGSVSNIANGTYNYNNTLRWISHNNIGYYFPQGGNLQLSMQAQTGTWKSINNGGSTATQTQNVFKFWIDHGTQPSNGTYAYYVVPAQNMQTYDTTTIRIDQNTADVQAVRHTGLNIRQFVFYKAGTFSKDSVTVTVDRPCVLMLKQVGTTSVKVYIADPAQTASPVNVYLTLPNIPQTRHLACNLPSGAHAGATAVYTVDLSTPVYSPSIVTAIADAYVRNGTYSGNNYGTGSLVLKKDAAGYNREVFLKFNVSSLPATTDQVKLRLYVNYANTGIATVPWIVQYVSNDSWTESGITFTNMPAATSQVDTVNGRAAGNYAEWDVTNIALAQQTADGMLTLKVIANATGATTDASFSPREIGDTTQRPSLVCSSGSSFLSSMKTFGETADASGISVYPNPANTFVRVRTTEQYQKAELRDATGRIVSVETLDGRQQFEMPLEHVKQGMYVLMLIGVQGNTVRKVVKL